MLTKEIAKKHRVRLERAYKLIDKVYMDGLPLWANIKVPLGNQVTTRISLGYTAHYASYFYYKDFGIPLTPDQFDKLLDELESIKEELKVVKEELNRVSRIAGLPLDI